jgi:hypothetical protein
VGVLFSVKTFVHDSFVVLCVTNGQRLLDRYSQYMLDDLSYRISQSMDDPTLVIPPEYLRSELLQGFLLCLARMAIHCHLSAFVQTLLLEQES